MTDDTTTEESTTEETVEEPAATTEEIEPQVAGEEQPKGTEAKLRKRAQAAEQERDALRTQLDTFARQAVTTHVSERLVDGEDYFRYGGSITWTDDGTLDVAAVEAQVDQILADRPHLTGRRLPAPNPAQGSSGAGARGDAPSWQKFLGGGK